MFYISSESEQIFKIPSLFTCWSHFWLYLGMWRTTWIGMWPIRRMFLAAHCTNDPCKLHCLSLPWSPWKQTRFWTVGIHLLWWGRGAPVWCSFSRQFLHVPAPADVGAGAWTVDLLLMQQLSWTVYMHLRGCSTKLWVEVPLPLLSSYVSLAAEDTVQTPIYIF